MKRAQKIMKTGNSAVVTIPARFLEEMGSKIGDTVLVRTNLEQGKMTCQFSPARQLPLRYEKP